ncbi:MAG: CPBP family intramembrane metalloprotease [Anaerolineae bacterium]|nr:CPBP family intramembrane metalloprotease [Anaerolineae bacterium]NIN98809.1 CPBP family intramembrane metalloprotease [Anaerolineae bacterium]NIQ81728.1 CPBP family intramembrane metalloprotease [Anaerolineae bacterium]
MTTREFFIKGGRLRPTWRVVCYVFALMAGTIAIGLPIGVLLVVMTAMGVLDQTAVMEMESTFAGLALSVLVSMILALPLTYFFRRFLDKDTMVNLGFDRKPGWWKEILGGLALGALLMGLVFLLEWAAGWLQVYGFAWQAQSSSTTILTLLGYVIILGLGAFWEELSFRGYILQNLNVDWAAIVALVASSILFGLSHVLNPNVTWLSLFNIFLAGVVLAICYLTTRQLWLPIAFHFSWNFFQGPIFSFPVSGISTSGLLLTQITGNSLITGGPFGPEAGVIGTFALVIGLLILWEWHRIGMGK